MKNETNTFFTKDAYETEIRLDVNSDVLKRIYNDGVNQSDMLPIEFVFITDEEYKANNLKQALQLQYPQYANTGVQQMDSFLGNLWC